jgi:hypothetical protein
MDIASLNQLLTSRLNTLNDAKIRAISVGDIEQVNAIDKDMMETKNTLQQLLLITNVAAAAASANTTPADVVNSGIAAVTNTDDQTPTPTVQGPSASAYINGYDISAYATDPLYEQKVQTIINAMPPLSNASDITTYIQGIAPGSPVTGDMVLSSAIQYSVDVPLLIAIMQNDSQFGTVGVGARTNNPGNVGNTGSAERTYNSWAEGVAAVAEWLNRHRIVPLNTTVDTPTIVPVTETPIVTPVTTPDTTTSNQSTTPTTDTTTPDQSTTTPTTDTATPTTTDTTTPTTDNSPVIQSDIPATDTGTDTTSGTNKTVGVSKQKRKNIA